MHFYPQTPSLQSSKTVVSQGWGEPRERSTYWPERLKKRASHRWLHFKGTLRILPMSGKVCKGSDVFSATFLRSCFPGNWIMVLMGLRWCHTSHELCPYLPGSISGKEVLSQQNQSPSQGKGPSEWAYKSPGVSPPAQELPAGKEHEGAFFFTLLMEFTRQAILSCLNAKHVSKISTSCVLTQEIDWNFQSIGYKTISLLLKLKPLLY